ncbi:hypothetical protein L202_00157 [Cryptococcus amylolentus CBS 6039]|uniref:HAD phosphatase, family IIIA n=2 Tax=Cryptococcus amylolentus TaxID=104669 RepID=A0A1E3I6G7_9TREE|nr:hypothetical protein L202_00157 [Cryptococcus amylolentus CBS 6039]ODN84152.1 hypothetical protein L202_00157 [Cryptococcus amylolentus CBS 6039]ODO11986.1 hypothetical protein I350_00770 [Cryptococcus amylolentus CBS 6273]
MAPVSNAFIYLTALFRPTLLRPHLRVPSIANVDFQALKREGYNAVVIDKDNCLASLTLPNKDYIWQPYETAWKDLLATFDRGRVLVVSNSAGTSKDPGGIAAEAVSLHLRAPVLLHATPKPGCSKNILSYFDGKLGKPHTLRHDIASAGLKLLEEEKLDEAIVWERLAKQLEGPLLGAAPTNGHEEKSEGKKVVEGGVDGFKTSPSQESIQPQIVKQTPSPEELRILVIGDRLFTDTLLADRLSRRLRPSSSKDTIPHPLPRVLSIYTTSLPKPQDVRPLRWLEEKLSKGQTQGDFSRFILSEKVNTAALDVSEAIKPSRLAALRWLTPAKWREIEVPPMTWHPRTWKLVPVAAAFGGLTGTVARILWTQGKRGASLTWTKARRWVAQRKEDRESLEVAKELETSTASRVSAAREEKVAPTASS